MEQKLRRAILAPWHPDAPMQLKGLSPACYVAGTETAQRFLAGAYDSVEAVLGNLQLIRSMREAETGDIRGRLTANEEDLLRAAIVFTGAGLDATLKQLIRDTLGALLKSSDLSHEKFEEFAAKRLRTGEIAEPKMIARYLTSETPRELLIEDYIYDLTGSSLQSAEEVDRAAGALGIDDGGLRKRDQGAAPALRRPKPNRPRARPTTARATWGPGEEDSVDRPHKGPLPRGA
jgi:hypothetical protein